MANTQAVCNSFKTELMLGTHALGTPATRGTTAKDVIKAALYFASATLNKSTTAYSVTGEVSSAGYPAGGVTVTNATEPTNTSDVSHWTPSASLDWTGITVTAFDTVLFYNSSQANKAIAVYTFGSQTVAAGNFSLTMPTNNNTTGLLRIS
jgi:hypothetical protein